MTQTTKAAILEFIKIATATVGIVLLKKYIYEETGRNDSFEKYCNTDYTNYNSEGYSQLVDTITKRDFFSNTTRKLIEIIPIHAPKELYQAAESVVNSDAFESSIISSVESIFSNYREEK